MQRTTLGELALWEPPRDEIDNFQRFVSIIDEFYPDDWRSWEVNNVSYEDLFGDRISSDEECRLRFAVPTVHLAYAFSDGLPSLSERKYKSIKRQLITWPLGRAIIYSPFATMKKIHPTDVGNRFTEVLSDFKSQLISRSEAAKILQSTLGKRAVTTMPSISQKRAHNSGIASAKKARNEDSFDALTDLMKQQSAMLEKLYQLSKEHNKNIKLVHDKISNQATKSDIDRFEYGSSEEGSWCAPSYNQEIDELARELESSTNELEEDAADLEAGTIESDTNLNVAGDSLVKQGIACQRLGTDSWQNIRYDDEQKKFQAAPVFTNLKVNSSLAAVTPSWQLVTVLEKMDLCLGAITHGLLQQRKEFQDMYQKATLEVKSVISKYLMSSKSSFCRTSDSLLQYTCGRRAEVIRQRRSIYKATDAYLYDRLHSIPPSSTHLFSEPKFSELVKEMGGINKIFPGKSKFKNKLGRKTASQRLNVRGKPRSSENYRESNLKVPEKSSCTNRRTRKSRTNTAFRQI